MEVAMDGNTKTGLGKRVWVVPEGYIPPWSNGPQPELTSHEAACILNCSSEDAKIELTIYFADCDPFGPYLFTVPANRTFHMRYNDLKDPEPIPPGKNYSSVFRSTVPVVIQHTRLDSRQAANALMTTVAYGE
jgi:hypothetical protein